jgi:hypothetical protein
MKIVARQLHKSRNSIYGGSVPTATVQAEMFNVIVRDERRDIDGWVTAAFTYGSLVA